MSRYRGGITRIVKSLFQRLFIRANGNETDSSRPARHNLDRAIGRLTARIGDDHRSLRLLPGAAFPNSCSRDKNGGAARLAGRLGYDGPRLEECRVVGYRKRA